MEQKYSFLDISNGNFSLIKDITITKETTFSALRKQFPNNKVWEVGTGYFWLYFEDCIFERKSFYVSLCFEKERLTFLEFLMGERQTSWEDWREDYELETERYYKQWLTIHIGENHSFDWGSIGVSYDRKGGRTFMWIAYKQD